MPTTAPVGKAVDLDWPVVGKVVETGTFDDADVNTDGVAACPKVVDGDDKLSRSVVAPECGELLVAAAGVREASTVELEDGGEGLLDDMLDC